MKTKKELSHPAKTKQKRKGRAQIKVCIIDDDPKSRTSLKAVLEKDKRIIVNCNDSEGLACEKECNTVIKPDIFLIDSGLKGTPGIECAKKIKKKKVNAHVVMMAQEPNTQAFAEARKIGADYIQKGPRIKSLLHHIISSIESEGMESYQSKQSVRQRGMDYLDLAHELYTARQRLLDLSESQAEVLKLRRQGKSLNEIAKILGIAPGTVHTHISRALKKLKLPDILSYIVST